MENQKRYTPFTIQPRDSQKSISSPAQPSQHADLFAAAKFAEIEYEATPRPQAQQLQRLYDAPSQPIAPKPHDPVKERFLAMRRIFHDNPYSRNDTALFYKQAKFMEDFADDYHGNEPFAMYFPHYQYMIYKQLRTYFTWRTKTRLGQHAPTSLSYIFVYIYELLSGIGTRGPADGLDKLLNIWDAHREEAPALDKHMPGWLKDYHVYYGQSFTNFVKKYNLVSYYPEIYLFEADAENCLTLWNNISSYNITKSNFYKNGNEEQLQDCFYMVVSAIKAYCASRNTCIQDLLTYEKCTLPWHPFGQALFYPWLNQPDHKVELPGPEVYFCVNNHWTANIYMHHAARGDIAGYIIKKTEECLRKAVNHKHQITAYNKNLTRSFRGFKKLGIKRQTLDAVIENAVLDYHKSTKRTVVVVDKGNLDRIRKEALGTQDLLVVPDIMPNVQESAIASLSSNPPSIAKHDNTQHSNGWVALKDALNPTEVEALRILLQDSIGLKPLADATGIMLEVLVDNINEKASDHIGDNLIDEDFTIYDDYKDQISLFMTLTKET